MAVACSRVKSAFAAAGLLGFAAVGLFCWAAVLAFLAAFEICTLSDLLGVLPGEEGADWAVLELAAL